GRDRTRGRRASRGPRRPAGEPSRLARVPEAPHLGRRLARAGAGARMIEVRVNGVVRRGEAEPRLLLSDFLRHELGLTGTHVGCEHGVCGACTVLLDGRSARSCLTFAVQADGAEIVTVEGLEWGALQEAF